MGRARECLGQVGVVAAAVGDDSFACGVAGHPTADACHAGACQLGFDGLGRACVIVGRVSRDWGFRGRISDALLESEQALQDAIQARQGLVARAFFKNVQRGTDLFDDAVPLQRDVFRLFAIADEAATFGYGQKFGQAGYRQVAPLADVALACDAEQGMGAIFDQGNAAFVAPHAQLFHRLRQAEVVGGDDCARVGANQRGGGFEVDAAGCVDGAEDRLATEGDDRRDHRRAVIGGDEDRLARRNAQYFQGLIDGRPAAGGECQTRRIEQARNRRRLVAREGFPAEDRQARYGAGRELPGHVGLSGSWAAVS